ncbi:26216_t:CDS:2, partial [Racocetra persica]
SSNTSSFKYLKFFKPEYHMEIADILKEVKAIRNNEIRVFDFENETDTEYG